MTTTTTPPSVMTPAGLRPLLEDQAVAFYTCIVSSIEPDATLTFEFTE